MSIYGEHFPMGHVPAIGKHITITADAVERQLTPEMAERADIRTPRDLVMTWAQVCIELRRGSVIRRVRIVEEHASKN